jgi:MFS family permease
VPVIKGSLGVSDGTFGLLLLGSAVGLVLAMWVAPWTDRRLGARAMQVLACAFALAWVLPGLVTVPALLFGALLLVGLSSGMLDVTMNSRVSELEARTGRSLMNGAHGMFSVGYTGGAVYAGVMRELGAGPVAALLGVAAFVILVLVPRMRRSRSSCRTRRGGGGTIRCGRSCFAARWCCRPS